MRRPLGNGEEHLVKSDDSTNAEGHPERWAHDERLHAYWAEPGKILAGEYPWGVSPGDEDAEEHRGKLELLADAGIETIFDLTSEGERISYAERWREIGEERKRPLRRSHYPIADGEALDPEEFAAIIAELERELAANRKVYIHCFGGRGRTGTLVGIWYVSIGRTADEALALIAEARRGTKKEHQSSPETEVQIDAIREAERRSAQ
jgi:protein-tyrosine phosphatase